MTLAWLESGVPALIFVLNLYIFIPSRLRGLPRNYPPVIRWRLLSALMSCILSTLWSIYVLNRHGITELSQWMAYMGLSWVNINFKAWIYSLLLTATLFLGPIYADWVEGDARLLDELRSHNWLTFRNYIGAPIAEEWVFRVCTLIPLRLDHVANLRLIFLSPLYFGASHIHHIIESYRSTRDLKLALTSALFQFGYTSIFGWYAVFVYLRTGSWMAVILCHAFCNWMGFPDFSTLIESRFRWRIRVAFMVGLVGFSVMLFPLTDPVTFEHSLWDNDAKM